MKRKTSILVIVFAGLAIILALMRLPTPDLTWGHGRLKASERGYYCTRIEAIIKQWNLLASRCARDEDYRIVDPTFTCLFVDTTQRLIGIEQGGSLLPHLCADLPPQMDWKIHHLTPSGITELPPVSRFRVRGWASNRFPQEDIFLVGVLDSKPCYLYFKIGSIPNGIEGNGVWKPRAHPWQPLIADAYGSFVVDANEYAEAQRAFTPAMLSSFEFVKAEHLKDNLATWTRVEKRLYQAIEAYITRKGYLLSGVRITPGPDYSAATGWANTHRTGWALRLRLAPKDTSTRLLIDHLGNDIWYVRTAPPQPIEPSPRPSIEMELLVSATGRIPRRDRQKLLAEGRAKQAPESRPPSKWQVTLPSGARVELIGVCESPSGGKAWWNPDGNPLGYAPYINYEHHTFQYERRSVRAKKIARMKAYEIAWQAYRVEESILPNLRIKRFHIGSFFNEVQNRYGRVLFSPDSECFAVDESDNTTTAWVSVRTKNGPTEWVMFKNISLVPGQDMGFEIVQGDEAVPEHP